MEGGDRRESRAALRRAIGGMWGAHGWGGGARGGRGGGGGRSGGGWTFGLLCFRLGLFVHRAALFCHKELQTKERSLFNLLISHLYSAHSCLHNTIQLFNKHTQVLTWVEFQCSRLYQCDRVREPI